MKNRSLLASSIIFSLALHAAALFFLQWNFQIFSPQTGHPGTSLSLATPSRGTILKEAFQSFTKQNETKKEEESPSLPPGKINVTDLMAKKIPSQPNVEVSSLLLFQPTQLHFENLIVLNDVSSFLKPPSLSSELLPLNLIIPTAAATPSPPKRQLSEPRSHPESSLAQQKPSSPVTHEPPPIALNEHELDLNELTDVNASRRASISIPSPSMPSFPTLDELDTASCSDWFDLELVFTPKEDGPGYLFALTLIPRIEKEIPTLRQHYTFLIDRSNSIQKDRLAMTKNAVGKALEELSPGDTFNVFVFDSKVEKLFPAPRKVDHLSLSLAKAFLNKITLGSFFSQANIYNPLALALPHRVEEDEIHNIILLSDGEAFAKKGVLRSVLHDWTEQSQGTVSLFALNMSSDSQLSSLEAATAFNRGWVTTSSTNRGLKRKLLKVMKSIHTPLAKNLACKAISLASHNKTEIFLQQGQSPHLYADHPFVIMGSTETLDNFILFVQGRLNNRWLNIKKNISFLSARQGSSSLKREWALRKSYQCYRRYFRENNPAHLSEAREILASYNLTPLDMP